MTVHHIKRTLIAGVLLGIALLGWNVGLDDAAAAKTKYAVQLGNATVPQNEVLNEHGMILVPLSTITGSMGLDMSYAFQRGLYDYHVYAMPQKAKTVEVWGNDIRGYGVSTHPNGKEDDEDYTHVYEPDSNCAPESDVCEVLKETYRGPIIRDGELYVQVRWIAKAFDWKLAIIPDGVGQFLIKITSNTEGS
ncbi:hypothetical protein [Paenibacillus alvei]|uniref:hypothetical protein n=1 Tax=Paenibacillus alvei TaxID=44250 RepID=UPI0018CD1F75|nr:hypothetical protein [Paenibacillus alvei]MBG9735576.1 hypothetical protein [Paenibacillus alvei]MBG9746693.1 hypothetical protein [Paenibacillus alvei]MCY9578471.1 hypothetical protein [Paenibacillus alvei]MCY9584792.1 hypothetical protein [Paenibacillus alvei]